MKIIKSALSFADRGQKACWLAALVALVVMPIAAQAQETSSAIRGRVLDEQGAAVVGASILIEDLRTNSRQSFTTNNSGVFLAARLAVGGPYRITVNNDQTSEIASLALGDVLNVTINLQSVEIEEIITVGSVSEVFETAPGPSATFGEYDLDSAVAFNRDIKDVYAIDPRLNLDGFQVNCAGKHPRFNSITLDGVSHNDRFGLNSNGYSTATGMPFPYDAIQQVSVELAPFDVGYGGFSACNVNAVTKSGSNEWEFGVFYETTTDSLINDELDGQTFTNPKYREFKRGFSVGGPIIKDKLFLFGAYEESDEPRFLAYGPAGSGGEEREWLSQSDYQRILDIVDDKYGFDTGGAPTNGAQTTESYLVRLDWNISDRHSVAGIYNYYEGAQDRLSDSDPNEFEFSNHGYVKGSISETYTAIIDSQWTDALSTQIYYSDSRMDDSQVTVGPKDIGDHQIEIGRFPNQNVIYLGADDSRQANRLYTDASLLKLTAQYLAGDHIISAGYEHEELEVFNIFVQHSRGGEWDYRDSSFGTDPACFAAGISAQDRFDNITVTDSDGDLTNDECDASGIDYFELGRPYQVYYGSGGGTNIADDAAAQFVNEQSALYIQDEVYVAEHDLTLTLGLRYEWIESDDTPTYNSTLSDAIGVRNDSGLDGVDILMPRLGLTWGARDDLTVRGGVGLYSGGNPNVWVANAWSRDGITQVQLRERYFNNASIFDGTLETVSGAPVGGAVPQVLFDAIAAISGSAGSDEDNVLISPDYKQPREWKYSLGATWDTGFWDITADLDYMYTRLSNSARYTDLSQTQVGTTLAGTPIYGPKPGAGTNNLMLTNAADSASGSVYSVVLRKDFDWGLDLLLGYAYTDVEDVSPMASFTAESSFSNLATNDVLNPSAGLSNYSVKDRVTLRASFAREFWGDNTTRFTLMGYYGSGQPTTYTMTSDDQLTVDFFSGALLYVPTGLSDPNVVFADGFETDEFFSFVEANGLAPGFVTRNSIESKDSARFDLRIDQEIPLYFDDLKARAFMKIYNFTNMLNDDWGRQYDAPFFSAGVVDIEVDDAGAFVFNSFDPSDTTDLQTFSSLWEIRMGIEVNFR